MIETQAIRELAGRYQTTEDNVAREYFQHVFLSNLYCQEGSDRWLFKGGTALRVIWRSPRFSEDLDFTGVRTSVREVESLLHKTVREIEREGARVGMEVGKKTSGGYLAVVQCEGGGSRGVVRLQISLRVGERVTGATILIASDLIPPYTLVHLEEKALVREKVQALLIRAKPRDFYDLYFILRARLAFAEVFQRDTRLKRKLLDAVARSRLDFKNELKRFLPVSQHSLLKDFLAVLRAEIQRTLP